jgi:fatty acid desaturase
VAPTVALNAIAFYVMFTVMHDSVHRTAHRSRFVNATLGRLSAFTLTVTLPLFRAVHYEHHSHTNDPERDPDLGVSRRPRCLVPFWCLGLIVEYRVHFYGRKLWRNKADLAGAIAMEIVLVVTLVASLVMGTFSLVAALWFGPALLAIVFLALTFDHLWTTIPWYRYQGVFRAIRLELEAPGSRVG